MEGGGGFRVVVTLGVTSMSSPMSSLRIAAYCVCVCVYMRLCREVSGCGDAHGYPVATSGVRHERSGGGLCVIAKGVN